MSATRGNSPSRGRRRVHITLALAIAGNLLGAGGAMYMLGSGTHDLTVDEALQRFRDSSAPSAGIPTTGSPASSSAPTPSPTATSGTAKGSPSTAKETTGGAPASAREPALGVYVYATDGYEETDALAGQRHDYPAETTLTISKQGCGLRFRWQPLKERWEESDGCRTSAGIVLSRFAIYHEFFHQGLLEDFALDENSVVMPAKPVAGATWHWTGHSDDSAIDTLSTVIGFETIAVGSEQIRAVHIRYETAMTGSNEGTQTQDRWLSEDTGLLIRMITAVDAKVAVPFGGTANYKERCRIDLTSTTPVA